MIFRLWVAAIIFCALPFVFAEYRKEGSAFVFVKSVDKPDLEERVTEIDRLLVLKSEEVGYLEKRKVFYESQVSSVTAIMNSVYRDIENLESEKVSIVSLLQ